MSDPNKIFFLGFNKTGTTSVYESLSKAGIKTCHNLEYVLSSYIGNRSFFNGFTAFTDGSGQDYHWLNQNFSNAHFILLTRDNYNWISSRFNHTVRNTKNSLTGKILFFLFNQFPSVLEKQIKQKILYENRVRHYFKLNSIPLLEIDIEKEQEVAFKKLSLFINNSLEVNHSNIGRKQGEFSQPSILRKSVQSAESFMKEQLKKQPNLLTYRNNSRMEESILSKAFSIQLKAYSYSRAKKSSAFRKILRELSEVLTTILVLIFDRKNKYY